MTADAATAVSTDMEMAVSGCDTEDKHIDPETATDMDIPAALSPQHPSISSAAQNRVVAVEQGKVDKRKRSWLDKAPSRLSDAELDVVRKLSFSDALPVHGGKDSDAASKVQIVIRIRPAPDELAGSGEPQDRQPPREREECFRVLSETALVAHPPKTSLAARANTNAPATSFLFTRIFRAETPQEELFSATTKPVIDAAFSGKNGLIFAYGVTNSGKTYTITGTKTSPGVLPRALQYVIDQVERRKENDQVPITAVTASYLEIYNDNVYDLLAPATTHKRRALRLQDCARNTQVRGLLERPIASIQDAEDVLAVGSKNKQVAETNCNTDSSRSHCIFSLYLYEQADRGTTRVLRSRVSIVDLAGSERGAKSGARGLRMQEASKINASLMNLMRCLETLRWNQNHPAALHKMVPYRESKLTRIFQQDLSGQKQGPVVMIVAVNPSSDEFDETLRTLKYSAMARELVSSSARLTPSKSASSYYDLDGRLRKRPRASNATSVNEENDRQVPRPSRDSFGKHMKPRVAKARLARPPLQPKLRVVSDPETAAALATARAVAAALETELGAHRIRTAELEKENDQLHLQISQSNAERLQMEVQIRAEIGNEMRTQLQQMKAHYQRMLARETDRHASEPSTAESSPHSGTTGGFDPLAIATEREQWLAERSEMQQRIAQLQEQLSECEAEMKRIQKRHLRDLHKSSVQHSPASQSDTSQDDCSRDSLVHEISPAAAIEVDVAPDEEEADQDQDQNQDLQEEEDTAKHEDEEDKAEDTPARSDHGASS